MLRIVDLVGHQRNQISEHPLLRRLHRQEPYEHVRAMAPLLAFWAVVTPDVFAVCEEQAHDPVVRAWVRAHRVTEEAYCDGYAADLAALGGGTPDLGSMFGPEHQVVRRACYAVLAEVVHAESDWTRVAVVLTIEAVSAELRARCARYRHWPVSELRYFSTRPDLSPPWPVPLLDRVVPAGEFRGTVGAVERGFDAFRTLFDAVRAASAGGVEVRRLRMAG